MAEEDKDTRLIVMNFPADVAEELSVLSTFNAVSRTEFIVQAARSLLECLEQVYPDAPELSATMLTQAMGRNVNVPYAGEEEPVLLAAEDEE